MHWINNFLKKLISKEPNPQKLALSFCLGNYVAFSPFLGLHTVLVLILSPLLRLNMAVAMAATYAINNPWTMIPIYSAGYFVGHFLLYDLLHLGESLCNPSWMKWVETFFETKLHMASPCLWSFLIGANILGIVTSIILYPIMNSVFKKLVAKKVDEIHSEALQD